MYIVYGDEAQALAEKYVVLELDSFQTKNSVVPTFCVVDAEHIPLSEYSNLQNHKDLHKNLVKNYKNKNWKYCEDAIKHLNGKFSGELDSFYTDLLSRVQTLKESKLDKDWTGVIVHHSK